MVLVFIVGLGLIFGAVIDFVGSGVRSSAKIADTRDEQLAIDGAVEGAMTAVRGSVLSQMTPCPPYTLASDRSGVRAVTVTCAAAAGTTLSDDEQPDFAVLTLGKTTDSPADADGNNGFVGTGNKRIIVVGGIRTNNRLSVSQGGMTVFGQAVASGACDGDIVVTDGSTSTTPTCNVAPTFANDPNYDPALSSGDISALVTAGTSVDPRPTCMGSNVIKFFPGVYTENPLKFLDDSAVASCKNANYWWFSPGSSGGVGAYYFDAPSTDANWNVFSNNASVIGGTPKGWDPVALKNGTSNVLPTLAVDNTGTLVNRTCDPDQPGVQFIMGKSMKLRAKGATYFISLCGSRVSATNKQRIVIYGLKSGTRSVASPETRSPSQLTNPVNFTLTPPPPGSLPAVAALNGDGPNRATLDLGGFGPVTYGGFIDAAPLQVYLQVAHSETGAIDPKVKVTLTSRLGSKTSAELPVPSNGIVDLKNELRSTFRWEEVNGISVQYIADGSSLGRSTNGRNPKPADTGVATLTSMQLRVVTTPAGANARPTCTNDADALVTSDSHPNILLNGTLYAPNDCLNLDLKQKEDSAVVIFGRGVIVRRMSVKGNPSFTQDKAPFQLSDNVQTRDVVFSATLAGESSPRLRALVRYTDHRNINGRDALFPGYKVDILSWTWLK